MTTERLWYGGEPGKKPGDIIAATAETRGNTGTVLVTTDRDYARQFAANAPLGDLYRVEAVPGMDLSRAEGHSLPTFEAPAVRVLSVYDRAVQMTPTQRRSLMRRWAAAKVEEQPAPALVPTGTAVEQGGQP